MKNRNLEHHDDWKTPDDFFDHLHSIYNFDFDPCPLDYKAGANSFDGLKVEWGESNFVNPPYSQKLKEAFVKKALIERDKGKLVVMLLPVSTSTVLFHDYIQPNMDSIEFVRGRLKFSGYNSKGEYVSNKVGMHDSMIIIFKPKRKKWNLKNLRKSFIKNWLRPVI